MPHAVPVRWQAQRGGGGLRPDRKGQHPRAGSDGRCHAGRRAGSGARGAGSGSDADSGARHAGSGTRRSDCYAARCRDPSSQHGNSASRYSNRGNRYGNRYSQHGNSSSAHGNRCNRHGNRCNRHGNRCNRHGNRLRDTQRNRGCRVGCGTAAAHWHWQPSIDNRGDSCSCASSSRCGGRVSVRRRLRQHHGRLVPERVRLQRDEHELSDEPLQVRAVGDNLRPTCLGVCGASCLR